MTSEWIRDLLRRSRLMYPDSIERLSLARTRLAADPSPAAKNERQRRDRPRTGARQSDRAR